MQKTLKNGQYSMLF